ncbi:hypothetical protein ACQP2F_38185 [Actinoplanes sp. CA-030573]|uniref:hypothetical protein n=1 Tax=Actinoplanes sp. CA-030573 TaxID=3239898 RepID=UPI003D8FD865
MSRRQVSAELQAVRALVAGGLERLERDRAAGDAPYWVESARLRLHGLDEVLASAAGGLSAWSRALVGAVIVFPLVWSTATGARAIGFGPAWVIVTAVVTLVAATLPIAALNQRLSAAVDRRRMRRATARATARTSTPAAGVAAPSAAGVAAQAAGVAAPSAAGVAAQATAGVAAQPTAGVAAQAAGVAAQASIVSEKDEVVDVLLRARVRLVSSALRQVPSRYWQAAHLAGLARNDPSINRISHADLLLCQAIDFLEIGAAHGEETDAGRPPHDGQTDAGRAAHDGQIDAARAAHDEARRAG